MYVLGRPAAQLHVDSTASVIGFCVSLSDVLPDGTSHLVAKGMLNVTRRDSFTNPSELPPGERAVLEVELDSTGWVFRAGHRLRISVSERGLAQRVADAAARHEPRPPRRLCPVARRPAARAG